MQQLLILILQDLKKGSVIQFVGTVLLVSIVAVYSSLKMTYPIASTALLYWEDGITTEEIEKSELYLLCNEYKKWPANMFMEENGVIKDRCSVLTTRHLTRTASEWGVYQKRARKLKVEFLLKQAKQKKASELRRLAHRDIPPRPPFPPVPRGDVIAPPIERPGRPGRWKPDGDALPPHPPRPPP